MAGSDKDYNDIIFQVRGATGKATKLDEVINPAYDWRGSDLGQALIAYAKPYVTSAEPIQSDPIVSDQSLAHPLTLMSPQPNRLMRSNR
jgi:hypothetical protein